jgi:hypothetical protein
MWRKWHMAFHSPKAFIITMRCSNPESSGWNRTQSPIVSIPLLTPAVNDVIHKSLKNSSFLFCIFAMVVMMVCCNSAFRCLFVQQRTKISPRARIHAFRNSRQSPYPVPPFTCATMTCTNPLARTITSQTSQVTRLSSHHLSVKALTLEPQTSLSWPFNPAVLPVYCIVDRRRYG